MEFVPLLVLFLFSENRVLQLICTLHFLKITGGKIEKSYKLARKVVANYRRNFP